MSERESERVCAECHREEEEIEEELKEEEVWSPEYSNERRGPICIPCYRKKYHGPQ